jgi:DNA-binding NarL/FixJ family response regulator
MTNPWDLTEREQDVLRVMVAQTRGGDKAIGKKLGLSSKTVATYVARACEKMEVASRLQAAIKWDREFNRGTTREPCAHCQGQGYIRKEAA